MYTDYEVLYQYSDDIIMIINGSGTILDMNLTASNQLWLPQNELRNLNVHLLHPDEVHEELNLNLMAVKEKNEMRFSLPTFNQVHYIVQKDVKVHRTQFKGNEAYYYIMRSTELTGINRNSSKFIRLFNESGDAYLVIEKDVISNCNDKIAKLFKIKSENLIGMKPWDISPEYQPDGMLSKEKAHIMINKALEEGNHRFEWVHKRSDQTNFWAEIVLTAIFNEDDSVMILVSLRDVSRRKKIELENNLLVERLNLATENTHTGLWDWNVQTGAVELNKEWASICGYTLEELAPISINTWIESSHKKDLEISERRLNDHFTGKKPFYECEVRMLHKNGYYVWVLDRGKVVSWTEDGLPLRMIGTHTEITHIKEAYRKLEEAIDDAQRMAEIAEKADETKSQFLANVSHEIRTPMHGVIGFLEMLKSTSLNNMQLDYVNEASTATGLMMKLINDLLDYSKLEVNQMKIESISFDIRNCIDEAVKLLEGKVINKGLKLFCVVHSSVPNRVIGDSIRLKQVIINLLTNAIKFTENGEVSIEVKSEHVGNENKAKIRFTVRDTGIGMNSETLNMLFRPFTQADVSTTRQYGGTGLGLSISKKLVKMMNGEIGVESEFGVGTAFEFDILLTIDSIEEEVNLNYEKLKSCNILIVDSNPTNRKILYEYLDRFTDYITMLDSSETVIELLSDKEIPPFDLILIDYQMPKITGAKLLRILEKSNKLKGAKTVLLSSCNEKAAIKKECQDLFSGYLTKPIKQNDLICILIDVMNQTKKVNEKERLTEKLNITEELRKYKPYLLLAEDNQINQKLLIKYFERFGILCDIASNGKEAVDAVKLRSYDLVLMDCQMPIMDGYTATKSIRKLEGTGHRTPIIALTAHAMAGEYEKCIACGMDDYLSKPVEFDKLNQLILNYAQLSRSEEKDF
jgi:PAS domain S-box-containing protein